jgi:type I restriction enzyme S subunit
MSNKEEKIMKPAAKRALEPKLRFPEFLDEPGWVVDYGNKLFNQTNNRQATPGLPILAITQEYGAIPRDAINYHVFVTDKSVENYKEVQPGDFIISLRSFQGGIEFSEYHGVCSPAYVILRKRVELSEVFFKHLFKSHRFIQQLTKNLEGLRDGKMISYRQFSELLLPNPIFNEQQKIADCLSSIDELVTLETQKLDTLKTHKKWLMQQLFPAEGETLPKLRFPNFRDAGGWGRAPFENLMKINSGKGFKAAEYSKDGIRLLQIENVGYGVVKWSENTVYLPQTYTLEHSELVLREGDIVLALNRPVTNNELKIARLKKCDEPAMLYQRVGKLELLSESIINDFAFHICQFFIKDFVIKQSIGSDQPFISLRELYAKEITIPSPSEQQRIADCLSSIDELITAQTQKLDTLKTHKKGLMQRLFPALDEVQG